MNVVPAQGMTVQNQAYEIVAETVVLSDPEEEREAGVFTPLADPAFAWTVQSLPNLEQGAGITPAAAAGVAAAVAVETSRAMAAELANWNWRV